MAESATSRRLGERVDGMTYSEAFNTVIATKRPATYEMLGEARELTYPKALLCLGYEKAKAKGLIEDYKQYVLQI